MLKCAKEIVCRVCGAGRAHVLMADLVKYGKPYSVYYCDACQNGFTDPVPAEAELAALYATGVYRVSQGKRFNPLVEALVDRFMLGRKRRIEACRQPGALLDIGCGRGAFLASMQRAGWQVTGVEFSDETAAYAREVYGVTVTTDLAFPDASFDVITVNHVLEHMEAPAQTIQACYRLLKKGGVLIVAVPNIRSLQATIGKNAWLHLDVPYHLVHFSEEGLSRLLQMNGFMIGRTRRFDLEQNPFGWLQTLLNLAGIRANLLYNLLKNPVLRKVELNSASVGDILLNFMLLPFFMPLALLLALLEAFLLKRGGTIELWGEKLAGTD
jgi:2-polyprenyl-3-methyl-5-hydroxy-6-metoxy-1,4-benzoquinol methylase